MKFSDITSLSMCDYSIFEWKMHLHIVIKTIWSCENEPYFSSVSCNCEHNKIWFVTLVFLQGLLDEFFLIFTVRCTQSAVMPRYVVCLSVGPLRTRFEYFENNFTAEVLTVVSPNIGDLVQQ